MSIEKKWKYSKRGMQIANIYYSIWKIVGIKPGYVKEKNHG